MRDKKTILVAMREGVQRDAVTVTLTRFHYNIHTARTAREAMAISDHHHMLLTDANLPGMDGLALIRHLRKSYEAPIIVLLDSEDESAIVNILDAGANDVLILPFGRPEHMARIRATLRYSANISCSKTGKIFSVRGLTINYDSRLVQVNGLPVHLTPNEFRIMTFLTRNAGKVLTHDQIINEVWGPYNSDNLVLRVNMANIRRKIEVNPAEPRYILTEAGIGYRVPSE